MKKPSGPFGVVIGGIHRAVGIRRALRGPKRPTWSHPFETLVTFLHQYAKRSVFVPLRVQRKMPAAILSRELAEQTTFEKVRAGGVAAEWIRHAGGPSGRVIYYLHGGGYCIGSVDSHRELLCRLCLAAEADVLALDYRLAPEHPFPAQLEDSIAGYEWLLHSGVAPEHIVIAGDSAGGGLTMSTLLGLRDRGVALPAAGVLLSPWVDLEATSGTYDSNVAYDYLSRRATKAMAKRFIGGGDLRDPLASPIHADLTGLPPLLVHAGGAEVLLGEALELTRKARASGVDVRLGVWPDMIHVWHVFSNLTPAGPEAIAAIGDFVRART